MTIWRVKADPYDRTEKVTHLTGLTPMNKEHVAKLLGLPYTPENERVIHCNVAEALSAQVQMNQSLAPTAREMDYGPNSFRCESGHLCI
jgi:hypothetical protein